MPKKRAGHPDVSWYVRGSKKPVAYSTVATKYLIEALKESCLTWNEVYAAINYDEEAKSVAKAYIDAGYGDELFRKEE